MKDKLVVLDGYTLNPGDLSWEDFRQLAEVTVHERTPTDQIVPRTRGHRYALTNKVPFSAATIEQLPELKYLGVTATGYNIVDVHHASKRGIVVTHVPLYATNSVAQHATALMLELVRQPALHGQAVHQGAWTSSVDWCFALTPITELTDKILGIVGLGRIGQAVARIGAAMGMSVIAYDVSPPSAEVSRDLLVNFVELDELFRQADVVSLHCPLTPETEHLVNARRLSRMKKSALLVNTSRGRVVDSQALAQALHNGTIAGAGLDVLDVEPPRANNPLIGAPNCIITPHIGWYAREARERLMHIALENLKAFTEGRPVNTVR